MRPHKSIVSLVLLVALALSGASASAAGAAPVWRLNGTELGGSEEVLGVSVSDSITVPVAATTCERTLLYMTIHNSAGQGKGEVTKVAEHNCSAPSCIVKSIAATKLPGRCTPSSSPAKPTW
jgi:hypothetical protein